MSQRSVEAVIGKLATDETFRRRFFVEPAATLRELGERGCELTPVERLALLALDPVAVESFAGVIDPRLQKV
jgi:hypothetical protein